MTENSLIMPEIDQEKVRECIKTYLNANGIDVHEAAQKIGIGYQTFRNYLYTKPLSERTVRKIAKGIGYPEDLLLNGEKFLKKTSLSDLKERVQKLEEQVAELIKRVK